MGLNKAVEAMQETPIFSGIDPKRLRLLAFMSESLKYRAGELLFDQGDEGDSAFVVLDGEAVDAMVERRPGGSETLTVTGDAPNEVWRTFYTPDNAGVDGSRHRRQVVRTGWRARKESTKSAGLPGFLHRPGVLDPGRAGVARQVVHAGTRAGARPRPRRCVRRRFCRPGPGCRAGNRQADRNGRRADA